MRQILHLDDFTESLFFASRRGMGDDNSKPREFIIEAVRQAMKEDLTSRQKECVSLYYLQGKTMKEIARMMEINTATVSRHLKKARIRLQRSLRFVNFRQ